MLKKHALNEDTETFKAQGMEIFAVGNWHGDKYTEKDLDDMITNFDKAGWRIPLKIGHDSKQKLAGRPAVGWIDRIYKVGEKLVADVSGIPKLVKDAINKRAFNAVSSEIVWDWKVNDTLYNKLLIGVALLGAEIPAINLLKDLPLVYDTDTSGKFYDLKINEGGGILEYQQFDCECIECGYKVKTDKHCNTFKCPKCGSTMRRQERPGPGQNKKEMVKMEWEKLYTEAKAKLTELEAKIKKMEVEGTDKVKDEEIQKKADAEKVEADKKIKEAEDAKGEAVKENTALKLKIDTSEVNAFVAKLETDKKIVPVMKERITKSLMDADNFKKHEYTIDEKKVEETSRESLMRTFEAMPEIGIFGEVGNAGAAKNTADDKLTELANKYALDNKVSFAEAVKVVVRENPKLRETPKVAGQ